MKSESEGDLLLLLLCGSVGSSFWRFISRVLFAFFEGHVFLFFWGDKSHTIQLFSVFLEFIRNRTFSSPTTKCRGEEEDEQTVTPLSLLQLLLGKSHKGNVWNEVTLLIVFSSRSPSSSWWRCRPKIAHTKKTYTTQEMYFVVTRRRRTDEWIRLLTNWNPIEEIDLWTQNDKITLIDEWESMAHYMRYTGCPSWAIEMVLHGMWCD